MRGIYYDPSVVLPRAFSLFKTNRPFPSLAVGIQKEKKAGRRGCVRDKIISHEFIKPLVARKQ